MRLHIFSDLHLEFAPANLPEVPADVIVTAGDIHPGPEGLHWLRERFPVTPVVYVLGNHEFYRQEIPGLVDELKMQAHGTNIHILENDRLDLGDVRFLGTTLWTDFELEGDLVAAQAEAAFQITDYRRIWLAKDGPMLRPRDSRQRHLQSRQWLAEQLAVAPGERTVVVTHHAPSRRSLKPDARHHPLIASYASDLQTLVEQSGVPLWIHGHIHHRSDYCIGNTRVIANPRGYPAESDSGFDSGLVIEI
jgi:Icc-related predicted phosphoesterase